MSNSLEALFDFALPDRAAWTAAVEKALAGKPLTAYLAKTADGLVVNPLAPAETPGAVIGARPAATPWSIVASHDLTDPDATNTAVLDDLGGGVGAIQLRLDAATLNAIGSADELTARLERAFEGVYLSMISVHLIAPADRRDVAETVAAFLKSRAAIGLASTFHAGLDAGAACPDFGLAGTKSSVGGQVWHARGAGEATELAIALAEAVEAIRSRGYAPADIEFRLVADQNQLATIAKLRAFRMLWALVQDELGSHPTPAFVHAEPAWRMMTRKDPWTNIIRSTIATFSAAVGGADAISSLPHTALVGRPDLAARRLARNVQTVLLEESNLDKVADPAAGAWGIEALTEALATKAWDEFRAIEAEGGYRASLAAGRVAERVEATGRQRRQGLAARKIPVTGVSTYPFLAEGKPMVAVGPAMAAPTSDVKTDGADFEELRFRAEAARARDGVWPRIFLANIGSVADFMARANFAKNLFEAGGIETVAGDGGTDPVTTAAAFIASGARLVCLASDDKTYDGHAAAMASALRDIGAQGICLAGRPRDSEAALREAGVDDFVYDGIDVLALLTTLHDQLGMPVLAEAAK